MIKQGANCNIKVKETEDREKRSNGEKICANKLCLIVLQIFKKTLIIRRLRVRYLGVGGRRRFNIYDKVMMINGVRKFVETRLARRRLEEN